MKVSFSFLGLFLVLTFASCSESVDYKQSCQCEVVNTSPAISKQIAIPVKGLQYAHEISFVYENDTLSQYWGFDKDRHSFDIFDLKNQKYIDSLPLSKEGKSKIPLEFVYDFFVHTPDSIFIHTDHLRKMFLINQKGQVQKIWELDKPLPDSIYLTRFYPATRGNTQSFILNLSKNEVIFHVKRFAKKIKANRYAISHLVRYSLDTENYTELFGTFPTSYREMDDISASNFPMVKTSNNYLISTFSRAHTMHTYNLNTLEKKQWCKNSSFLPKKLLFLKQSMPYKQHDELYRTQGQYLNLVYSPYTRKLYRIVIHPQANTDKEGLLNQIEQAKWSILVLDEATGACLGEYVFEKEKYDFFTIYAVKEGLLISRENEFNPDNQEDVLSFDIITL